MTVLHDETIERPFDEAPETTAKPAWGMAFKRAWTKFNLDHGSDLAASLTYRSIQSLFPALIAILSLLNIFGNGKQTTTSLINSIAKIAGKSPSDLTSVTTFINNVQTTKGGIAALIIGVGLALWSASGYVGAFSRALNRIYAVAEGRPVWKLRPWLYLITVIEVILVLVVIAALVATGSVAKEIGNSIGLGSQAVLVWDIAKWPVVAFIVICIISMLYRLTPNVDKRGSFLSAGAAFAFVIWVVLSIVLVTYFGLTKGASYQKTYGVFAGAIMLMLWLYITNMAMLFGAELDAEVIRTKQLKSGLPAERLVLLPARDTTGIEKQAAKDEKLVEAAHELRMEHVDTHHARSGRRDAHPGALALGTELGRSQHGNAATPTQSLAGKGERPLDHAEVRRALRDEARDASTDDARSSTMTASGYDPAAEKAQIAQERQERKDEALDRFQRNRDVRARLDKQRAKEAAKAKEAERKRQEEIKAARAKVSRQERWDQVEHVRALYAPRDSVVREEVMAERNARRAEWKAAEAEKAAMSGGAHAAELDAPKRVKEPSPPMPSPLRDQIEAERTARRAQWERARGE